MRAALLGVALLILLGVACRSTSSPSASAPSAAEGGGEGGHEHTAPHGGTLVELGDELAHLELLLDASTGTLTAYALDGEAERAVRLAQSRIDVSVVGRDGRSTEVALAGVANALTGETDADTSQFLAIVPALKGVTEFDGSIKAVAVRGQRFHDVAFRYPSTAHE